MSTLSLFHLNHRGWKSDYDTCSSLSALPVVIPFIVWLWHMFKFISSTSCQAVYSLIMTHVQVYQLYQLSGSFFSVSKCWQIVDKKLMGFDSSTWLWSATLNLQRCTIAHSHFDVKWNASANLNMLRTCLSELLPYI